MANLDQREALLKQDGYLIGLAMLSLLNGMDFSPYFEAGLVLVRPLLFGFYITSPLIIFYLTSLMLALITLILAGVPAAIFERMSGRKASDGTSLAIWLGCTALLALPSIGKLLGFT